MANRPGNGRYLAAFEQGTMPTDLCGPRLEKLRAERAQLQAREQRLRELLATNTTPGPDPAALAAMRRRIRDVFTRGDGPTRKALLKTLIAEIKVEDRGHIRPFFYVPTLTSNKPQVGVRDLGPQVEVGGLEPPSHNVVPGLLRAQPPGESRTRVVRWRRIQVPARLDVPERERAPRPGGACYRRPTRSHRQRAEDGYLS